MLTVGSLCSGYGRSVLGVRGTVMLMPGRLRQFACLVCGAEHTSRSSTARTCSKKCSAVLREQEHPSQGRSRREYEPALVLAAVTLYESGLSVREVQERLGVGAKAQQILERHLDKRRGLGKRQQHGSANSSWKGSQAKYAALHLRVIVARGQPRACAECGQADAACQWANLTGHYDDVNDYARLCARCHGAYDRARRALTGTRTTPSHLRGDGDV